MTLTTITADAAATDLEGLLQAAAESHEPVSIVGEGARAVLVGEDLWRAIGESMFLLAVPGMRESIQEGMRAAGEDCAETLDW